MRKFILAASLLVVMSAATADPVSSLKEFFMDFGEKAGFGQTLVIPSGHPVMLDGAVHTVWGNSVCPTRRDARIWYVGGEIPTGGTSCIVVEKDTKQVLAQFKRNREVVTEWWTVERPAQGKTVLRRPNGSFVAKAQ